MKTIRKPSFKEAIIPIIAMFVILVIGRGVYSAPIETLLIMSAAVAAVIAWRVGLTWDDMIEGVSEKIAKAMPALLILIAVGQQQSRSESLALPWHCCGNMDAVRNNSNVNLLRNPDCKSKVLLCYLLYHLCNFIHLYWYILGLMCNDWCCSGCNCTRFGYLLANYGSSICLWFLFCR